MLLVGLGLGRALAFALALDVGAMAVGNLLMRLSKVDGEFEADVDFSEDAFGVEMLDEVLVAAEVLCGGV